MLRLLAIFWLLWPHIVKPKETREEFAETLFPWVSFCLTIIFAPGIFFLKCWRHFYPVVPVSGLSRAGVERVTANIIIIFIVTVIFYDCLGLLLGLLTAPR